MRRRKRVNGTRNIFSSAKKPTCSSHQTPVPDPLRNFLSMYQSFYTPAFWPIERISDHIHWIYDPSLLHLTDREKSPIAQQKPKFPNNVIPQCHSKPNHGTKRSGESWVKNHEGKVKNLDDEPLDVLDECPCLIHGAERAASLRMRETRRPSLGEWVGWPDEAELLDIN